MKIFILLLCFSQFLRAQDFVFDKEKGRAVPSFIGQIKLMRGSAFKKASDGALSPVKNGERFKKSDSIVTKERSFVKVLMIDDTMISVGPQSELFFEDYDFTDKEKRSFLFTLVRGQLTGDVKNRAEADQLKFKTKHTTMGIRGTYILMNTQMKNALEVTQYALLSGKAAVTRGSQQEAIGKGDHMVLVSGDAVADQEKLPLSPEDMEKLEAKGIDDTKEVKPFLPFSDISGSSTSHLKKYFQEETVTKEESVSMNRKREEAKPSWQQNLKKLNEKIKENQKKKR